MIFVGLVLVTCVVVVIEVHYCGCEVVVTSVTRFVMMASVPSKWI